MVIKNALSIYLLSILLVNKMTISLAFGLCLFFLVFILSPKY